jgi:hypothetical protein
MKKRVVIILLLFAIFSMSSFVVHKFYMGIFQINYASEKKMLQITTRIFLDDLTKALEKKHNKKILLESSNKSPESIELLKKYLSDNFIVKVNGQQKSMNFLSEELDDDVLVCYLSIKDINKIKSLEINNSVLTESFAEQQNIVHITAFGNKKSFLFTASTTKQVLNY